MPTVPEPNYQLCTYSTATTLANKLRGIGVSVDTIYEIDDAGNKTDTSSDNYFDNKKLHQFVADIWGGPEQSLAITNQMFKENGYTYESFTKLAATSNVTDPDSAIMQLAGVVEAVNRALTREMERA